MSMFYADEHGVCFHLFYSFVYTVPINTGKHQNNGKQPKYRKYQKAHVFGIKQYIILLSEIYYMTITKSKTILIALLTA